MRDKQIERKIEIETEKQHRQTDRQTAAHHGLGVQRDGVQHHQLREGGLGDPAGGRAGEDAVGGEGVHSASTLE